MTRSTAVVFGKIFVRTGRRVRSRRTGLFPGRRPVPDTRTRGHQDDPDEGVRRHGRDGDVTGTADLRTPLAPVAGLSLRVPVDPAAGAQGPGKRDRSRPGRAVGQRVERRVRFAVVAALRGPYRRDHDRLPAAHDHGKDGVPAATSCVVWRTAVDFHENHRTARPTGLGRFFPSPRHCDDRKAKLVGVPQSENTFSPRVSVVTRARERNEIRNIPGYVL